MIEKDALILHEIDHHALDETNTLLQSGFWGLFKEAHGWKSWPFLFYQNGEKNKLLALSRRFGGVFSLGYVPFGPQLTDKENYERSLAAIAKELQGSFPLGALFVRFDLPDEGSSLSRPFIKAPENIQPADTVVLNLTQSEDELLAGMHKKTRYNIRLAEKKGVSVRRGSEQELKDWYEVYRITALRDKIAPHSLNYFIKLFTLCREYGTGAPELILYLAEHEGELLAGNIVSKQGDTATYLYGATSNHKREFMPAYLLQWTAIIEAKQSGVRSYDFHGIPPAEDPKHPLYGLYRFKTGFGGTILHRRGSWDYPYSRLLYPLYRFLEKARFYWYRVLKKKFGR